VTFLYARRRDLLDAGSAQRGGAAVWIIGALISAVLVGSLPCLNPSDGLQWFAEQQGLLGMAGSLSSIDPDYIVPGLEDEAMAPFWPALSASYWSSCIRGDRPNTPRF